MITKKEITITIIVALVVIALIVALAFALNACFGDTDSFNTAQWVANPANPASPLHSVLF